MTAGPAALPAGVVLDTQVGPFEACLDADLVSRYGTATADPSTRVRAGEVVPPTLLAMAIWDAQVAALDALVPATFKAGAAGGVHGEHDLVLHRPVRVGEPLRTWAAGHGARPVGRNARTILRYVTHDAADEVVAEQLWTTVWFGTSCTTVGDPAPDHSIPDDVRTIGSYEVDVDTEMARRYAEVSGDWSAHHFEVDAAQRSGAARPFLHGLCTMALCAQAVAQIAAAGDPERVRRIAVRFAAPMLLGDRLRIDVSDAGPVGFAFTADGGGGPVITHGRAELA